MEGEEAGSVSGAGAAGGTGSAGGGAAGASFGGAEEGLAALFGIAVETRVESFLSEWARVHFSRCPTRW